MITVAVVNAQRDSGQSNTANKIPRHLVTIRDSISKVVLLQKLADEDPLVFDPADGVNSYKGTFQVDSNLIDLEIINISLFNSHISCNPIFQSTRGSQDIACGYGVFGEIRETDFEIQEGGRFSVRNIPFRDGYVLLVETYNFDDDNTTTANVLGIRSAGDWVIGESTFDGILVPFGKMMRQKIELYKISNNSGIIQLPNRPTWYDGETRPAGYYIAPIDNPEAGIEPVTPPTPIPEPTIPDEPTPIVLIENYVFQLTPWYRRKPKFLALLRSLFAPMQTVMNNWSSFEQLLATRVYQDGTTWSLQFYLNRLLEYQQGTIIISNQVEGGFKVKVPSTFTDAQRQKIKKYVDDKKLAGVIYTIENFT